MHFTTASFSIYSISAFAIHSHANPLPPPSAQPRGPTHESQAQPETIEWVPGTTKSFQLISGPDGKGSAVTIDLGPTSNTTIPDAFYKSTLTGLLNYLNLGARREDPADISTIRVLGLADSCTPPTLTPEQHKEYDTKFSCMYLHVRSSKKKVPFTQGVLGNVAGTLLQAKGSGLIGPFKLHDTVSLAEIGTGCLSFNPTDCDAPAGQDRTE